MILKGKIVILSVLYQNLEITKLLLELGAIPKPSGDQIDVLHIAVNNYRFDRSIDALSMIDLLVSYGAYTGFFHDNPWIDTGRMLASEHQLDDVLSILDKQAVGSTVKVALCRK